jgi:hypothetical protein
MISDVDKHENKVSRVNRRLTILAPNENEKAFLLGVISLAAPTVLGRALDSLIERRNQAGDKPA